MDVAQNSRARVTQVLVVFGSSYQGVILGTPFFEPPPNGANVTELNLFLRWGARTPSGNMVFEVMFFVPPCPVRSSLVGFSSHSPGAIYQGPPIFGASLWDSRALGLELAPFWSNGFF